MQLDTHNVDVRGCIQTINCTVAKDCMASQNCTMAKLQNCTVYGLAQVHTSTSVQLEGHNQTKASDQGRYVAGYP